ncbi:MAG TPA: VanZ family protein [Candidatus Paceibacterota bacterium]|jgi:Glycopeptide antibiotics resistance protein
MELAINFSTILLFGLIWFGIVAFLRSKKKKGLVYLLFFTIFYIYIAKVLAYTQFQFQFQILNFLMPGTRIMNGDTIGKSMNLIPLLTLTAEDLKTSLLNILLFIPFGFGLPFITNMRIQKTVVIGALFSFILELLQLISALMAHMTFRVIDINDLIFNTVGVATGYLLFTGFMHIYRSVLRGREMPANPILRYIAERPQTDTQRTLHGK